MSKKYKIAVLTIVGLAVIAVLLITRPDLLTTAGVEKEDALDPEVAEFSPAPDSYQSYIEARQAEMPIVLEFYARW